MDHSKNINFLKDNKGAGNSTYELQKMKQIHHEIVMLALLGYDHNTIAAKLECSETMVSYTLRSEIVKDKLEILREQRDRHALDVLKRIEELQPHALDAMEQMLFDPNTNEVNKRQIAQDLLDRGGTGTEAKARKDGRLSTKEINNIKDLARKAGMLVEAEEADYEEVEDEEVAA